MLNSSLDMKHLLLFLKFIGIHLTLFHMFHLFILSFITLLFFYYLFYLFCTVGVKSLQTVFTWLPCLLASLWVLLIVNIGGRSGCGRKRTSSRFQTELCGSCWQWWWCSSSGVGATPDSISLTQRLHLFSNSNSSLFLDLEHVVTVLMTGQQQGFVGSSLGVSGSWSLGILPSPFLPLQSS